MKKLFIVATMALAGLSLGSCSSDQQVAENPTTIADRFNADGEAFMSLNVMTPTVGTSRANDVFEDATADEVKVNSAVLLLFQGASEDAATFFAAYPLTNAALTGTDGTDDVQKKYTVTLKKNELEDEANLYALVVLNYKGVLDVYTENKVLVNTKTGSETLDNTKKFSDFKKYEIASYGNTTDGMLMSNAPLANKNNQIDGTAPTGVAVQTLAQVTADNLQRTAAAAENNALTVFVERVAAKVQLSVSGDSFIKISDTYQIDFDKAGVLWTVDNLEPTFYPVRNISTGYLAYTSTNTTSKTYRFLGQYAEIDGYAGAYKYRTYWAEDPHYNYTAYSTAETGLTGAAAASALTTAVGSTLYLAENTMNEQGLTQDKTSRVVLMIPFKNPYNQTATDNDFYTLDDELVIYPRVNKVDDGGNLVAKGAQEEIKDRLLSLKRVREWLNAAGAVKKASVTDAWENHFFVTLSTTAAGKGVVTLSQDLTEDATQVANFATIATEMVEVTNAMNIQYYKDGKVYYTVRLMHFGDSETPLEANVAGSTYEKIYGATPSAADFLGRYGVVRNNFYAIDITAVKKIGKPTVPEIPTTPVKPDDEIDQLLSTKIYVTKWAKRSSSVSL